MLILDGFRVVGNIIDLVVDFLIGNLIILFNALRFNLVHDLLIFNSLLHYFGLLEFLVLFNEWDILLLNIGQRLKFRRSL